MATATHRISWRVDKKTEKDQLEQKKSRQNLAMEGINLSARYDLEESGAYCLNFYILLLNAMEGVKHDQYRLAYIFRMERGRHPGSG